MATHQIKLQTGGDIPLYLLIYCSPREQDWNVTEVEVYYDAGYSDLMSDDNPLHRFPRSTQDAIYGALDAWDHERRQAAHSLRMECERMARVAI